MDESQISQDDIIDVMEMTDKILSYINYVLKDNDRNLAISALINACISGMLAQCKTLTEVMFYRTLFIHILDNSIKDITIEGPQKPPSS